MTMDAYEIYNDSIKSLYKPENDLEITSVKNHFGYIYKRR